MNADAHPAAVVHPEASEPRAARTPVPVWLIIVTFGLVYWGMIYFDHNGGWFQQQVYYPYRSLTELQRFQPPTGGINLERGRVVFENFCGLCHNNDGMGKPNQAPPLAGSEWATGSATRMIHVPLLGLSGPLQVKGQEWNLAMPAMGTGLTDDDLAAALSYIRQSWGNKASPITPEQVKAVRGQVGSRTQPLNAAELNQLQ
jgi:mono/diheme cytochrome c family protein